jgi:prepilin-type processing-associated H-X9-DG protein
MRFGDCTPGRDANCGNTALRDDQVDVLARSRHGGGVNVAYADGHVRFVPDSIDLAVWQALATVAGGETNAEP